MYKKFIFFLLIYIGQCEFEMNLPNKCIYKTKFPDYGVYRKALICSRFRSFDEIKIVSSYLNNSLNALIFIPLNNIIFDQSLDLSHLVIKKSNYWVFYIFLSDFKGFDLESSPFMKLHENKMNHFGFLNSFEFLTFESKNFHKYHNN